MDQQINTATHFEYHGCPSTSVIGMESELDTFICNTRPADDFELVSTKIPLNPHLISPHCVVNQLPLDPFDQVETVKDQSCGYHATIAQHIRW